MQKKKEYSLPNKQSKHPKQMNNQQNMEANHKLNLQRKKNGK